MIEERLAACVNILGGCRSIYRWQGEIETADEVAAIFKTGAAQAPLLAARIAALHSYDVPAVTVWPIEHAPAAYIAWAIDQVS
jgi:periplasmic divalent cation tolerance protein